MRRWKLYLVLGGLLLLALVVWQPKILGFILLGVGGAATVALRAAGATKRKPGRRPRRGGGGTERPPTKRSPELAEDEIPMHNKPVRGPRRGGF